MPLEIVGEFPCRLERGDTSVQDTVYVAKRLTSPLLGRPAIERMGLVSRVDRVTEGMSNFPSSYPKLFSGLGLLSCPYHIRLMEDARPYALSTPRRIALPLLPKVKEELSRMESMIVITRESEPTDWCSGMVVVPKANGKVRICVDLTKLNQNVKRERHMLPSVKDTMAQLKDAHVFTKLDTNSGFWQIPLTKESSMMTTFITPYARYRFNRLPFGISSAPENFQRRMSEILEGLTGLVCLMDDILIFGKSKTEHDERFHAVLQRLQQAGVTLKREKCLFSQQSVKFLSHLVGGGELKPDPEKVKAIQEMPEPSNIGDTRRFLGLINQQARYITQLAEKTEPLRSLLVQRNQWMCGPSQKVAFENIKKELTQAPALAFYLDRETVLSADASSFRLGAVLCQRQPDGYLKPVAYASRSLSPTECRYAQVEKEALAITWSAERFSNYLIGKEFLVETDHKPLVPLLGQKGLDKLPPRIQRFRMRLLRFQYSIVHIPGKDFHTADALCRQPISPPRVADEIYELEVAEFT